MNDNIKVAVRIRPLLQKAIPTEISWIREGASKLYSNERKDARFEFDTVFGMESTNTDIFQQIVQPIVDFAVNGYNGTIFAYGQTASGKTYTMMGASEDPGVIPQAVDYIFECIENTPDRTYLLRISLMELYNEQISDLLSDSDKPLKLCEHKDNVPFIMNLTESVVQSASEMLALLNEGKKRCHIGETLMNERSSRSHTIFRIVIESQKNLGGDDEIVISQLNLVDLAGSEKSGQVNNNDSRFKEGCSINLSLLALTQVISKLSEGGSTYINFRDSKLTRILKPSLGGNAKTAIICNITPTVFDETLSTLKFAERAKTVKNKPKINAVLSKDSVLKRYEKNIADLQNQLEQEKQSKQYEHLQKQLVLKDHSILKLQEDLRSLQEKLLVSSHAVNHRLPRGKVTNRRETWCVPGTFQRHLCSDGDEINKQKSFLAPESFHAISPCIFKSRNRDFAEGLSNLNASFETIWPSNAVDVRCLTEIDFTETKALNEKVASLLKENKKLHEQVKDIEILKKNIAIKNNKIEEMILSSKKAKETIDTLEAEIQILTDESNRKRSVREEMLSNELQINFTEINSLNEKIASLLKENKKLLEQEREVETLKKHIAIANNKIEEMTLNSKKANITIDSLEADIQILTKESNRKCLVIEESLSNELQSLQKFNMQLLAENDNLKKIDKENREALQKEFDNARKLAAEVEELKFKNDIQYHLALSEEMKSLQMTNKQLLSENDRLAEIDKENKRTLEKLQNHLEDATSMLCLKDRLVETLRTKLEKSTCEEKAIQQKNAELKGLIEQIDKLKCKCTEYEISIKELEKKVMKKDEKAMDLAYYNDLKFREIEKKSQEKEQQITSLLEQIEVLKVELAHEKSKNIANSSCGDLQVSLQQLHPAKRFKDVACETSIEIDCEKLALQNELQKQKKMSENCIQELKLAIASKDDEIMALDTLIKRKEAPLLEKNDNLKKDIQYLHSQITNLKRCIRRMQEEKQNNTIQHLTNGKDASATKENSAPPILSGGDTLSITDSCKLELVTYDNKKLQQQIKKLTKQYKILQQQNEEMKTKLSL